MYKHVLKITLNNLSDVARAKPNKNIPVVFSQSEVCLVISHLKGIYKTIGSLLYGSGLRLSECLKLRVLDVDLSRAEIVVRQGKGNKDRTTVLPEIGRAHV